MSETPRGAWGAGLITVAETSGRVLDAYYPAPQLGPADTGAANPLADAAGRDERRGVRTEPVLTAIDDLGAPPADAPDAYLRLHLLSHRLIRPRELNLDGIFGVLANIVWTNVGSCAVEGFEHTRLALRRKGPVQVFGVDKFPRMTDYVIPTGVRIADADRVRL